MEQSASETAGAIRKVRRLANDWRKQAEHDDGYRHFPAERDKRRKSMVFRHIAARASAPASGGTFA